MEKTIIIREIGMDIGHPKELVYKHSYGNALFFGKGVQIQHLFFRNDSTVVLTVGSIDKVQLLGDTLCLKITKD